MKLVQLPHPIKQKTHVLALEVTLRDTKKNSLKVDIETVAGFVVTSELEPYIPCSVAYEKGITNKDVHNFL